MKKHLFLLLFSVLSTFSWAQSTMLESAKNIRKKADDALLTSIIGEGYDVDSGVVYDYVMAKDLSVEVMMSKSSNYIERIKYDFKEGDYQYDKFPSLPFDLKPNMSWIKCHKKLKKRSDIENLTVLPHSNKKGKEVAFMYKINGKYVQFFLVFKAFNDYKTIEAVKIRREFKWY